MVSRAKEPSAIDKQVGERVRMRRLLVNMSQTELGEKIGVTFQQVQKYEKGTNRIGSSRLHRIAEVLEVPVSFFFEDVGLKKNSAAGLPDYFMQFMGTSLGQQLVAGLSRISDKRVLRDLLTLVESIADPSTNSSRETKGRRPRKAPN